MDFKDEVIIVTGSGRGIGKAVVTALAEKGAKVVINDIDEDVAYTTAAEINEKGGQAIVAVGGVDDALFTQKMVQDTVAAFGTVTIVINNAAITRPAMIDKMTEEQWDSVIDIGLKGIFNMYQAVAPIFKERGKNNPEALSNGKVINITSVAALTGTIGQINYAAAKAGVIGMTRSAAREWGKYRIQSNAVAFGIVETRMTETIRGEKFEDIYKSKIVLNRFATVEDVVPGILFLASSGANYITGDILNLSGGYHIGS